jgi:CRISPR-associated protein Cas5t
MRVLKIVAEGLVTSFRYPHFVQGVQITYYMPPPATIYGHVCSAVGKFISPQSTRFAYTFTYAVKFTDYEHLHFFGKEPKMNPFQRELLFQPRLTLYLTDTSLKEFFLSPRYAVVLGRSQDLMTYIYVNEVELQPAESTFFSNTLLRLEDTLQIRGRTYSVTMPRFVDENRQPTWGQYAVLNNEAEYPYQERVQMAGLEPLPIWVDPEPDAQHSHKPLQRGVIWHDWV